MDMEIKPLTFDFKIKFRHFQMFTNNIRFLDKSRFIIDILQNGGPNIDRVKTCQASYKSVVKVNI